LALVLYKAKALVNVCLQALKPAGIKVEFLHFGAEEAIGAGGQAGDMDNAF